MLGVTRQMTSSASLFSEFWRPESSLSNLVFQSINLASSSSVFQASNPTFFLIIPTFLKEGNHVYMGLVTNIWLTSENLTPEEIKNSCTTYSKKNLKSLKETHPSKMQYMDAFQWKHMVKLERGELIIRKQLNTLLVKSQEHDKPAC